MSTPDVGYSASLRRGRALREQGRFRDAESFFRQAVEAHPLDPEPYCELAVCFSNTNRPELALQALNHAIGLDPRNDFALALKALIFSSLSDHRAAVKAAEEALALNPSNLLAINARTRAWIDLRQWPQAYNSARHAVAIAPNDSLSLNLLACTLRLNGRVTEATEITDKVLTQRPSDAGGHFNAGWNALERGQAPRAELHFRESLRLQPHNEQARLGLLQSLYARVWFYRFYFKVRSYAARRTFLFRFTLLLGLYMTYLLSISFTDQPVGWMFFTASIYLSLLFAKSLGDFFLLVDPLARLSLCRKEALMGALTFSSIFALTLGMAVQHAWLLLGLALVIPFSFLTSVLCYRFARNPRIETVQ